MVQNSLDPIHTRHSLLLRLKDWGDQRSWQDFFETYWQLIYNVAVKAGLGDVEAQEVVQETVLAVAKKISEFKADPAHGSFNAWLMHLTRWRIADQFRRRGKAGQWAHLSATGKVRETSAPGSDDTAQTDPINRVPDPEGVQLEHVWNEEWEKSLLTAALEQVKRQVGPKEFQIFDLNALQGLSVEATARTMQVRAASVYVAKHRISRLVRREVAKLRDKII
jgi:RNA polymerase sigma-70 factor (ECF subfamily)